MFQNILIFVKRELTSSPQNLFRNRPPVFLSVMRTSLIRSMYTFLLFCFAAGGGYAQVTSHTTPVDGIKENVPRVHAFTNATLVTSPGEVIYEGTLVIRDGVIVSVGDRPVIPGDARIHDMKGKTIYPGFIDAWSSAGMGSAGESSAGMENARGTQSWNPQVRAHIRAEDLYDPMDEKIGKLRSQGFTSALAVPGPGIFRGQAAFISLGEGKASVSVMRPDLAHVVSLNRSREAGSGYPTSPAGAMALIRQTLLDVQWHDQVHRIYRDNPEGIERPEIIAPLAALEKAAKGQYPLLFETNSEEELLRVLKLAGEFSVTAWIRGSGHEYKVLELLEKHGIPLILPLNFPETPDVRTPEDAMNRSLAELRHWYLAPENPARLDLAGIPFALTADGLSDPSRFLDQLREAVRAGLAPQTALEALTTRPARMLGVERMTGTLKPGLAAHFVVTDGDLFGEKTRVLDVWVDGNRYRVHSGPEIDPAGTWALAASDAGLNMEIRLEKERRDRYGGSVVLGEAEARLLSATISPATGRLHIDLPGDLFRLEGRVRLSASLSGDELFGWTEMPGGSVLQWDGRRTAIPEPNDTKAENYEETDGNKELEERAALSDTGSRVTAETGKRDTADKEKNDTASARKIGAGPDLKRDLDLPDRHPAMDYGRTSLPEPVRHVLVRNATIWTMGPDGVLEGADLLVTEGRVAAVGRNLAKPEGAKVIDADGRHVTPGLIDAHLHSGLIGVNEVGNAIVPEVRMCDVLTRNNIWTYRQLAGGLTSALVMHGSANPIGGQNFFVKMRWGMMPDDLIMDDAPPTLKFALGENPKRVGTDRYPDTRMGVEQIIADRFRMALDYQARHEEWKRTGSGLPPRRDLRMETLVDILNEKIRIQAHCYRQDEILALMRLGEEFGITIDVFHHGVEAYKVAPELAAHGAAVVVWSDWSSFKIEAYDATVYNARLLKEAGVLTSLHSDQSQIASRMNWEAAKMVRAGMEPVDALALVTIDAAKLHGIDHRVGSLEPGKDGDFVLWSGNPLSTLSITEQTWIEGRQFFDLEEDQILRQEMELERSMLIQRILEVKND